jgi:aspartyl-tRNA(Asn)/glutamyl-tRNA(Gln) amidotransferase subunit A
VKQTQPIKNNSVNHNTAPDIDLLDFSISEISALIRGRKISSVELVQCALDRAVSTQAALNAFIDIDHEGALREANALDNELVAGKWRGPLHGIPLAHKDCFERQGKPMTIGSRVVESEPGIETASVLNSLSREGAINIGSLNMNEMAAGPTGQNPHFGDCCNAWDVARISGGSSSGSATAVAIGAVFGSLGSDTGGSIRLPASMNGLFGMKPTYGRLSRAGCFPRAFSLDCVGPLARSAEDCAILLQATAGGDARDPSSLQTCVPRYPERLTDAADGSRLAVLGDMDGIHPEIGAAFNGFVKVASGVCGGIGHVPSTQLASCYTMGDIISKVEAATLHGKWMQERGARYSQAVFSRTEPGLHIPAVRYLEAIAVRGKLLRAFLDTAMAEVDVLLYPTVPVPVPTRDDADMEKQGRVFGVVAQLTRLVRSFNYLGLPVLTMPVGLDSNGMPIGVQLIGRPLGEARLLSLAHRLSSEIGWRMRPARLAGALQPLPKHE